MNRVRSGFAPEAPIANPLGPHWLQIEHPDRLRSGAGVNGHPRTKSEPPMPILMTRPINVCVSGVRCRTDSARQGNAHALS